ncbi:MFS transporter [Gemmobacter serpentinus]|uniref:MFS transporter n=1 Tax=Gemmobacter serpentinus TaxID=2652247 RepID=UPI00124C1D19|nr:MFS transporter [Gemmobacter serpentinus]
MQSVMRGRWAVAGMFLVNGMLMGAWAPQIPLLLPRHDIGEAMMGLLILGLGLGAIAAMLFAGRLIQRFGSVPVLILFAAGLVPVLPAVIFAPSLPLLALAMMAFGALAGTMDVAMNANAVEVERGLGRAIMSSSHGFWSLGGFLGGSLGGVALKVFGREGQSLAIALVMGLIVVLAARHLWRGPQAPAEAAEKHPLLPRSPIVWLLGLTALMCMVPEGAIMDWSALFLINELGLSTEWSGLGFALFSASMAVMRFAGDAVRNRFGAVRTLRVSALIAAAALLAASVAPSHVLALAAFALAGLGIANTVPIMLSAAGNLRGMSPGAGLATVAMVGYAGILVAPSSIGFIAEHAGFRGTWAGLSLCLLFVATQAGRARDADGTHRA